MANQCPQCPRLHPPIHGDGPQPSMIMVIGEAPAKREVEGQKRFGKGRVLVGDSGIEYSDHYLPLAGLARRDVYTTNIVKCASKGFDNPTPFLATCCSDYWLHRELRVVQPSIIITMGAVALHTLFPGHSLEMEHGIPFRGSWGAWVGTVVPMYHPAAGLRSGRFMIPIRADWVVFGKLLESGLGYDDWTGGGQKDEHPEVNYWECVDEWDVRQYLEFARDRPLAMDTEVETLDSMAPYCLSFSHTPGTSRVIRATSKRALVELDSHIQSMTAPLIYHNALFDPLVLESFGLHVLRRPFRDTMMDAYHLGNVAQSLKTLAWRLAGMRMQEFQDVAGPYSKEAVALWLAEAEARLSPVPIGRRAVKSGKRKGQSVAVYSKTKTGNEKPYSLVKGALSDLLTNPEMDPWDRWKGWVPEVQEWVLATMDGVPIPPLSICHVPWPKALHYSARDADATIRVHPILKKLTVNVGRPTL